MTIRTIIVDDEPLARRGLELRLRDAPDIEIVRQCANGREALAAIAELLELGDFRVHDRVRQIGRASCRERV